MLPGGLRTKLVLSFSAIILLCLVLAGSAFVYLLQPYVTQQALNRLAELALPLAVQVRILEAEGATPREIGAFLDEQARGLDVRILLVRQEGQIIIHDTADRIEGDELVFQGIGRARGSPVILGTADVQGEGRLAVVSFAGPIPGNFGDRLRRLQAPPSQFTVALAAPESGLAAGWRQVATPLFAAAVIALCATIAASLVIARSISRPLAAITRASEAMARGDYNQQIQVKGRDEVARLASTFNAMAEQVARSNRTLRDLLADVSHELRTPLTTIQGFAEAILDGTAQDDHSVVESARIIKEDAERMHRLVEDLLYLARIESGQLSMDIESVNLVALLDAAVRRARQRAEGRSVNLEVARDPQYVPADPHRIEQVLDNLLSNAIRHTPGGGAITVKSSAVDGEAHVSVHNTGSYVPPEDRDRIFERFSHGGKNGSGTGLGLAIALEIARAHGGRIDLESEPESGTEFTVVLPVNGASRATA